jgi:putative DNA primase/helicase
MVLSNELPRMADASGALASRFVILMMTNSFYGREDTTLTSKLLTELSPVFNWSLDGFERLEKRGCFQQPKSSEAALREMEDLASPISAFARERCVLGPEHEIVMDHLYLLYREWCVENGRKISNKQTFGRDLGTAFPRIRRTRPRDEAGGRYRTYRGIAKRE